MRRPRPDLRAAAVLLALALAGCMTSPAPSSFPPALSPTGQLGAIKMFGEAEVPAELLSVQDSVVIVLTRRVAVANYRETERMEFGGFAWPRSGVRVPPWGLALERARALSRFPFGIPDGAMAELLRANGQTGPDTLRARAP